MKNHSKLFVHELLENVSIKRKLSRDIPRKTLDNLVRFNRPPIKRHADIIIENLQEYDEYKNISSDELEKKLYETAQTQ